MLHRVEPVNSAIAAVTAAKASVMFINNVPLDAGLDPVRSAQLEQELSEAAYKRFVESTADARAAVAAVVPYYPQLVHYLNEHRAVFEQADAQVLALRAL